jgi:predicted GTPase
MTLRGGTYWWREGLLALAWLLPLLVPYGAGLWWLYQENALLAWMGAMAGISLILWGIGRLSRRRGSGVVMPAADVNAAEAERRAREGLSERMESVRAEDLANTRAVERLVRESLICVASAWHPGRKRAELRFTVPEGLALLEHLAGRLQIAIHEDLPALEQVKIAHVVGVQDHLRPARSLWNLYRAGRFLFNPVGATVVELRRGVLQAMTPLLMDSMKRTAGALLVREVGEAAILLYSGRLSTVDRDHPPRMRTAPEVETGPLLVMLAGQANSGKSSVINALSGRDRAVTHSLPCAEGFQAYALEEETAGELLLVDSPGLPAVADKTWLREVSRADVILWVAAAHRADRQRDEEGMRALQKLFEQDTRRRRPPILGLLTHVDRLDPAREWDPPYDVARGERQKEQNMRTVRADLAQKLNLPLEAFVCMMTESPETAWNVEEFWKRLYQELPSAGQSRLERLIQHRSRVRGLRKVARTVPGMVRQARRLLKS